MRSILGPTVKEALENMLAHIETEYDEIATFLDPAEVDTYRAYYKDMPIRELPPERRLSAYRRFYRGYLRYLVTQLVEWEGAPPRILDAGSGLGTQSILFALLGAGVHGVDLRQDRVVIAEKRARYWEEKLNAKLDLSFACESVFSLPEKETYDFIWVCQAISHIDPAEEFLGLTCRLLKPGGRVVIYDPNGMHIPNQLYQLKNRGVRVHRTYETHTGETVAYAVERLFTYGGIQRILRRSGFQIAHRECQFHRFRGKPDDGVFERIFRRLDFLPVFTALFGCAFVVAGRKPITGGTATVSAQQSVGSRQ